jgi:hypothetical protein
MTKRNLSFGILLIGAVLVAANYTACSSNNGGGGSAGTTGTGNTQGVGTGGMGGSAAGGSTGTAGMMCMNNAATVDASKCKCVTGAYVHSGACMCQTGMTDVCPTTGCTNKMLDATNCGTCGTACMATSTCNAGTCGPAPTTVLPAIAGCMGNMTIAVSDAVYYTDGAHNTVNKVGGTAPLASAEMGATMLAINGTNLFWYSPGAKKIRMIPAAGGTAADVYTNTMPMGDAATPPSINGFLVSPDGMSIYISIGTQVLKAPVAGGTPIVVANEVKNGVPAALALDGTSNIAYPATINGDVDAPVLGGTSPAVCGLEDAMGNDIMTTCPRLGRSQGELLPTFIAVVAGHAYWVDGTNLKGEMIPAAGAMGTTFDTIAMAQTSTITAAVSNGTDTIYFADADPTAATMGFIEKTALAPNSTPILVARAQNSPVSIALDSSKVYWATADCAIMSSPK